MDYKPQVSTLYRIMPINIDNEYVEGLTSYLARLANAHCVTIRCLGLKLFNKDLRFSRTLNGNSDNTRILISQLETATMIQGLNRTTMLPWMNVLSSHDLLKKSHSWCPECYKEWACKGLPIYEPLIWSLSVVSHCPNHMIPLQNHCPNEMCGKVINKLGSTGKCPYCGEWLGQVNLKNNREFIYDKKWISWVHVNCFQLLQAEITTNMSLLSTNADLRSMLNHVLIGFDISNFSRKLGLKPSNVLSILEGRGLPKLGILLKILYGLNLQLKTLLENSPTHYVKRIYPSYDPHRLNAQLETLFDESEDMPATVKEVAKRLNCSESVLRKHIPNIRILLESAKRKKDPNYAQKNLYHPIKVTKIEIQNKLHKFLSLYPPQPLTVIAETIGRDSMVLKYHFPELCKQVVSRYKTYLIEQQEQLKALMYREFSYYLNNSTSPISLREFARRLNTTPQNCHKHWPDLTVHLIERKKTFLKEKGYTMNSDEDTIAKDVENLLKGALSIQPPPSLAQISRNSQYRLNQLKKHAALCEAIKRRHDTYVNRIEKTRRKTVRKTLKRQDIHDQLILSLGQEKPGPLESVAKKIGLTSRALKYHFPDLCRLIVSRYESYRVEQKRVRANNLRNQLVTYLRLDTPNFSLAEIARRNNASTKEYYDLCPDLARLIVKQYKQFRAIPSDNIHQSRSKHSKNKINLSEIQSQLLIEVASTPPKSLKKTSHNLGCSPGLLQKKFPELCSQIIARYQRFVKDKRIKECLLIRTVVFQLKEENIEPTMNKVIKRTRPGIFSTDECKQAFWNAVCDSSVKKSL